MDDKHLDLEGSIHGELLKKIKNEDLRDLLKKKYEEEAAAFSQAAQDFCPSTDNEYWAKKSCHKCYGRGIIGKRYVFPPSTKATSNKGVDGKKFYSNGFMLDAGCVCATKNYKKWLAEFRHWYNALKAQTEVEVGNEATE